MLLNGALALSKTHHLVVFVCQKLDFHMVGGIDILFQINRAVSKGGLGLQCSGLESLLHGLRGFNQTDATAAAAGARFDQYWIADGLCSGEGCIHIGQNSRAGNDRNTCRSHHAFGLFLITGQ